MRERVRERVRRWEIKKVYYGLYWLADFLFDIYVLPFVIGSNFYTTMVLLRRNALDKYDE